MTKKLNGIYLAVYVVLCIVSLGSVWFFKNLLVHAIYDAKQLE